MFEQCSKCGFKYIETNSFNSFDPPSETEGGLEIRVNGKPSHFEIVCIDNKTGERYRAIPAKTHHVAGVGGHFSTTFTFCGGVEIYEKNEKVYPCHE